MEKHHFTATKNIVDTMDCVLQIFAHLKTPCFFLQRIHSSIFSKWNKDCLLILLTIFVWET